ncbi:MAG: cytochrome c oxidase subunit 2 [Crocinitomicaceae bacterium]|jgi:cytochrome c oxidase subunit 2
MSDEEWNMKTPEEIKHSIKIELYGQQFHWTAHYAGADNEFPKFDYKLVQPENDLGILNDRTLETSIARLQKEIGGYDSTYIQVEKLDGRPEILEQMMTKQARSKNLERLLQQMKTNRDTSFDKFAMDDFLIKDTLYLGKDIEHEFSIRAKDVIHSAYFPHFRAQMNAVPGMTTRFKYTPAFTTEEMRIKKHDPKFNYVLMCNKICGEGHYKMKMIVKVVERDAFRAWVKSNKKNLLKNNDYFD